MVGAALALAGLLATAAPGATAPPLRLVRVAVDSTTTSLAQHATIVEPDAVASGSRIVTTFQVGRFFGGSAGRIGFARSNDAGRTWRWGLLPGVGVPDSVASDPVVAFDALHATWLIATLVNTESTSSLAVHRSSDGLAWASPITAVGYPREDSGEGTALDKEWITCDNGAASPFLGRCYLAYTDIAHEIAPGRIGVFVGVQSTSDGGLTWSTPVLLQVDADQVSPAVQPVVRPDGELVVVFFEDGVVEAVRSTDGGVTFSERERISNLQVSGTRPLRGFSLPTAAVDASGNVYAAWPDCRFRSGCVGNDIVWSRSNAPGTWTPARRAPLGTRPLRNFTIPDMATDRISANRLALTYYALTPSGLLDTFLVTSRTAGRTWSKPRRLNRVRMRLTWIAQTASGRMVGDYMGTVFSGSRVVAVHVQARAPRPGRLNEALYAASIPRP